MVKKINSVILALIFAFCSFAAYGSITVSALSESDFTSKIAYLQTVYRDKEYWNGYNACGYEGTGSSHCYCTNSCSASCSCKCGKFYLNGVYYGGQCYGFANKMGYLVFGSVPTASWSQYSSVSNYYAGDYVRVNNNRHSIFITKVSNGTVTYVDCNNYGPCQVKWNRSIAVSTLKSITTHVFHYPGNTLTGTGTSGGSEPVNEVTWTQNTAYPTPISAYPIATSGKITLYNASLTAYETNVRNIAFSDLCTINAVYTNGYCSVTYPTASGTNTEYAKASDFFAGTSTTSWTADKKYTSYTRSNMSTVFGSVSSEDACKRTAISGNYWQVIYPVSGGYKLGWIDSSYTTVTPEEPRPAITIPGPVASGILNDKTIVAVAPSKITTELGYISEGDICKLYGVNASTGYCTVDYPGGGASDVFSASVIRTVNLPISSFIDYNPNAQCETANIPEQTTVYPTSAMTQGSTNWYLSAGDSYTTINQASNGATEVLYHCDVGKHAGCWKLGWAWISYYWLDLNGYLDNFSNGGLSTYGTADVYINGIKRADDVNDFYSANGTYPRGSTYVINDIKAYTGYTYNGVYSGSASGDLTANTSVALKFTKNPVTCSSIYVSSNPTKTTYLEGESLNTSGLVITANFSDGSNENVTSSCSFSGYTSTPGTKTVTVNYSGKSTAFTVLVKSKSPTALSIASNPTKTNYYIGDEINLSGLVVKATYDNGTTANVTDYDIYTEGITSSSGEKTVSVTYVYNDVVKTASFTVNVSSPAISLSYQDISLENGANTTLTATTQPASQTVTWTSSDESVATVSGGVVTGTGVGTAEITSSFTYNSITYSATANVTVVGPTVSSVSIKTLPSKTTYYAGENLDTTGLTLEVTYSNGTTDTVSSGFTCDKNTFDIEGQETVTVNYLGKTATFNVEVLKNNTPVDPDAPAIKLSNVKSKPGDEITVDVIVENNPGIVATSINISYDNSKLQLISVTDNGLLGNNTFIAGNDINAVPYTFFWEDALSRENYTANGAIATLKFKILDDAEIGSTVISITCSDGSTFNSDLDDVAFTLVDGTVDITNRTPGDANGDGALDLKDVVMIRRWLAGGWTIQLNEANADVNGDNIVNLKDVVLIKRYLAGGFGTELK